MSWPVALPAVSTPVTSPRLRTNQRPATVATKASAIDPVPSPTSTPQSSTSCQLAVMKTVSPLPGRHEQQRDRHHPPDAEPVHQRGGERRGQAEQQQVDRDRERDGAAGPAVLVLQRRDQRARAWPGSRPRRSAPRTRPRPPARRGARGSGGRSAVVVTRPAWRDPADRRTSGRAAIMCKNPAMTDDPAAVAPGRRARPGRRRRLRPRDAAAGLRRGPRRRRSPALRGAGLHRRAAPGPLGVRVSRCCPEHGLEALAWADTVIVAGVEGRRAAGPFPAEALEALRGTAGRTRTVSICTGAFVLASAGLLDGRPATTHWLWADLFRELHPDVLLDPQVLFVDDGDVLTSAGVAAGVDLCLHLVRARPRRGRRQPGGPALRGAAVAQRRPVAVHRAARPAPSPRPPPRPRGPGRWSTWPSRSTWRRWRPGPG